MTENMSEYESCEFETWGLERVSVGVCDERKATKKVPFTRMKY